MLIFHGNFLKLLFLLQLLNLAISFHVFATTFNDNKTTDMAYGASCYKDNINDTKSYCLYAVCHDDLSKTYLAMGGDVCNACESHGGVHHYEKGAFIDKNSAPSDFYMKDCKNGIESPSIGIPWKEGSANHLSTKTFCLDQGGSSVDLDAFGFGRFNCASGMRRSELVSYDDRDIKSYFHRYFCKNGAVETYTNQNNRDQLADACKNNNGVIGKYIANHDGAEVVADGIDPATGSAYGFSLYLTPTPTGTPDCVAQDGVPAGAHRFFVSKERIFSVEVNDGFCEKFANNAKLSMTYVSVSSRDKLGPYLKLMNDYGDNMSQGAIYADKSGTPLLIAANIDELFSSNGVGTGTGLDEYGNNIDCAESVWTGSITKDGKDSDGAMSCKSWSDRSKEVLGQMGVCEQNNSTWHFPDGGGRMASCDQRGHIYCISTSVACSGNNAPTATPTPSPTPTPTPTPCLQDGVPAGAHRFFVSKTLVGASDVTDALCNQLARNAGFSMTYAVLAARDEYGPYLKLLVDYGGDISTGAIYANDKGNPQIVANNFAELFSSSSVGKYTGLDQGGNMVDCMEGVWTGSKAEDGNDSSAGISCNSWSDTNNKSSAQLGQCEQVNSMWHFPNGGGRMGSCNQKAHIYCISTTPASCN